MRASDTRTHMIRGFGGDDGAFVRQPNPPHAHIYLMQFIRNKTLCRLVDAAAKTHRTRTICGDGVGIFSVCLPRRSCGSLVGYDKFTGHLCACDFWCVYLCGSAALCVAAYLRRIWPLRRTRIGKICVRVIFSPLFWTINETYVDDYWL